jgi:hypothetical protein
MNPQPSRRDNMIENITPTATLIISPRVYMRPAPVVTRTSGPMPKGNCRKKFPMCEVLNFWAEIKATQP